MAAPAFRVVVAGLGYFSQFHLKAWSGSPLAALVGLCDSDPRRLADTLPGEDVERSVDLGALVAGTEPDIVDIVAPPQAHVGLVRSALAPGRTIICQKPFCTSVEEAAALLDVADAGGSRIVIHENFRFQPWHRQVKDFLDQGRMGRVYQARFALRPGDGRGPRAYLDRQPAFQQMPRLLIHETGVHFFDLFRWFFGPIEGVYAETRRLNPAIAGEDEGLVILHHASGVRSVFDGNRLSDHLTDRPRRTMGEMQIEGEGGTLFLGGDGRLSFRPFGSDRVEPVPVAYPVDEESFGGGCVAALIDHVLDALADGREPANLARDYLHVMHIVNAAYRSAQTGAMQPSPDRS